VGRRQRSLDVMIIRVDVTGLGLKDNEGFMEVSVEFRKKERVVGRKTPGAGQ